VISSFRREVGVIALLWGITQLLVAIPYRLRATTFGSPSSRVKEAPEDGVETSRFKSLPIGGKSGWNIDQP